MVYCVLAVLVFIMAICRFSSLVAHNSWRKAQTTFPASCADWSIAAGCTYITMTECTRGSDIIGSEYTTFSTNDQAAINKKIAVCANSISGAKLQSPKDLSSLLVAQNLVHVTFSSALFGFIDDMYLQTYFDSEHAVTVVNIMSQLRVGKSDFGVNTNHVQKMLTCLGEQLPGFVVDDPPCVNWA